MRRKRQKRIITATAMMMQVFHQPLPVIKSLPVEELVFWGNLAESILKARK